VCRLEMGTPGRCLAIVGLLVNDRVLVEPLSGGLIGISIDSAEESHAYLAAHHGGDHGICCLHGFWWGAGSMCRLRPCLASGPESGLTAAERLSAENDVRSTLLQGLGGLLALGGVAFGAVVTLRQVRASSEGRSIDLFTKAIDQLASDQVSVRHGNDRSGTIEEPAGLLQSPSVKHSLEACNA
jgi:hypothetical protein